MGLVPQRALPTLAYRPHALRAAVKSRQRDLAVTLPSNYQYLATLHRVHDPERIDAVSALSRGVAAASL